MAAAKGNKYAVGANNGRPKIYETPEALQKECTSYFEFIQGSWDEDNNKWLREPEPPTVTGLALYLGFADKSSIYDYRDRKDFFHPIKRSLTIIEQSHEIGLNSKVVTGHIFALKNSGWKDQSQTDITSLGEKININPIFWVKNDDNE